MAIKFSEKVKTIFSLIFDPKTAAALISQKHTGFLVDVGWFKSYKQLSPVDANNNPIPWVTYPFIHFIEERLTKKMSVFEYGAGNSTLYYAQKVGKVVSVEHNRSWYNDLQKDITPNVDLRLYAEEKFDNYSKVALSDGQKYDMIIIDAIERVECLLSCIPALKDSGVIILDDSERVEYASGIKYVTNLGYRRIDFWGIAPGVLYRKCTTIFYKADNCLGI